MMSNEPAHTVPSGAPEAPKAARFVPLVGTKVRFDGTDVVLTLTSVEEDARMPPPAISVRAFSLSFRGPRDSDGSGRGILPEGLHRCTFAEGRTQEIHIEIHIAPIHTHDPEGQIYQAVFN